MLRSAHTWLLDRVPDKVFVYFFYLKRKHQLLPLRHPQKFTQKLPWLKMFGQLERFARYADKFAVREYVQEKIGAEHLIPLLGAWDTFEDIPFDTLPDQFVLKVTHGCGYNFICKDKTSMDHTKAKRLITRWLSEDFYKQERETQYKPIRPRIIAEAYLEDETGSLRDFKIWCSKGEPKVVQVDTDRFTDHKSDLFDTSWSRLDFVQAKTFGLTESTIKQPDNLAEMLDIARQLSCDFPFVRVDLYSVDGRVYFGELTFTPGSGLVDFDSADGDVELGKLIDLPAYKAFVGR